MSQQIGLNYKTRIPTFSDDASIEEALKLYHYGVDNYSSQSIPQDSIEGHFLALDDRLDAAETAINQLPQSFIEEISSDTDPNEIVPANNSVVPLTIKGVTNQIAELQRWRSAASVDVASIFPNGGASFAGYVSVGNIAKTETTTLNIRVANSAHKGIVVQGSSSQLGNLQEWQNNSASVLAKVDSLGTVFSNGIQVVTLTQSQTLTNKTLTSPTITTPAITGGTITNASSINLTGAQQSDSFRARNIYLSNSINAAGGNDGDIWITYV